MELEVPITDESLLEEYLVLEEEIYEQLYPHEPVPSKSNRRQSNTAVSTSSRITVILAKKDHKLVGRGLISENLVDEARRHICYVTLQVLPHYQNMGIGSKILQHLVKKADENGLTMYRSSIHEIPGQKDTNTHTKSWLEGLAAHLTDTQHSSRLYQKDLNLDLITKWYNDLSIKLADIELRFTHKDDYITRVLQDDKYVEKIVDYFNEVGSLIPRGSSSRSPIKDSTETIRKKAKDMRNNGWGNLTLMAWDPEEESFVGSTQVYYPESDNLTDVKTGLTAVRKAYWGQGLGTYMKTAMLLRLNDIGFKSISTGNDEHNDRMLAINNKLGFKLYVKTLHYEGKFDSVKRYLND